jgi:hypothetical protein
MIRLLVLSAAALAGCGSPVHLQYDHGRASTAAYAAQANPSASTPAVSGYDLSGQAGLAIRTRVLEQASDTESGKAEYVQVIGVE